MVYSHPVCLSSPPASYCRIPAPPYPVDPPQIIFLFYHLSTILEGGE